MEYFDAHCHIQFPEYDIDRDRVIDSMLKEQVGGLVVGVDYKSSKNAIELVEAQIVTRDATSTPSFFAAVGLHPNDVLEEEFVVVSFEELANHTSVRAIGECGLDYYRPEDLDAAKNMQKRVFEEHIELAARVNKPLMIHSRPSKGTQDAYHDTIDILRSKKKEYGDKIRGDMHFFVGGVEEARQFVELGFSLSYTAVITFARDYDDVIRYVPLEYLISETDSPFVAPAQNRGKRNEPIAVKAVVEAMSQIRGEELEKIKIQVLRNASRLFSFSL